MMENALYILCSVFTLHFRIHGVLLISFALFIYYRHLPLTLRSSFDIASDGFPFYINHSLIYLTPLLVVTVDEHHCVLMFC